MNRTEKFFYPNQTKSLTFSCHNNKTSPKISKQFPHQNGQQKIVEKNTDINLFYKSNFTTDIAKNNVFEWLQSNYTNTALKTAVRKFVDFYEVFLVSRFTGPQLVTACKYLISKNYLTNDYLSKNLGVSKFIITNKSRKALLARIASKLFIWQFLECNETVCSALAV
jgi:hypothetical protein